MNQAPRIPTLDDVRAAQRIAPYLSPTPVYRYDDLTELVGTEIWVKRGPVSSTRG
jgi:threonine dehydratase